MCCFPCNPLVNSPVMPGSVIVHIKLWFLGVTDRYAPPSTAGISLVPLHPSFP